MRGFAWTGPPTGTQTVRGTTATSPATRRRCSGSTAKSMTATHTLAATAASPIADLRASFARQPSAWVLRGHVGPSFSRHRLDWGINRYCGGSHRTQNHLCDRASVNILQLDPLANGTLTRGNVQWNICRNFEWQVCATQGRLPKQRSGLMRFTMAPATLWLDGSKGSPKFARCSGYHQAMIHGGRCLPTRHFANDDVFFLEACVTHRLCRNGGTLFQMQERKQKRYGMSTYDFTCDFSPEGFAQLRALLLRSEMSTHEVGTSDR